MGAVAPPSHRPAHDEQPAIIERFTKSGRKLFYQLSVIQQPERARACGSGPKSSADRRPVDPPPVVELRIFEGQTWQEAQQKDITFLYNANFFLYATLEHARHIAHGRVQTPAANQPPVLTGMPVSGMAYLDRPQEAGYFLFPDLSVRHEGRYRLTFNLYEETKEDKDKDPDAPDPKITNPGLSVATGGSFDFRMEVKSLEFVVFSAKKFPGLSESTQLSRVVAEQGCRVRIRRDVRMRRRDRKAGGDYDTGEDEYARRRRTETPESRDFRARSMSGSAERTPYSVDTPRRPSGVEYPPHYPSQSSSSGGGHLQFLGTNPQYPQSQPYPQPPSIPQSPSYQTSQPAPYSHQASYAPPPPQQPSYSHPEQSPSEAYASANPSPHRPSAYKRASDDFTRHQPPHTRPHHADYPSFNILQPAERGAKITLPPIGSLEAAAPSSAPGSASSRMIPPLISPTGTVLPQILPQISSNGPPAIPSLMVPPVAGSKRTRDESFRFDDSSRYHNGAREDPRDAKHDEEEKETMQYSRADGRRVEVPAPPRIH